MGRDSAERHPMQVLCVRFGAISDAPRNVFIPRPSRTVCLNFTLLWCAVAVAVVLLAGDLAMENLASYVNRAINQQYMRGARIPLPLPTKPLWDVKQGFPENAVAGPGQRQFPMAERNQVSR